MAAPQGVRVVRADGSELPVELTHRGFRDGRDEWAIASAVEFSVGDHIAVAVFPPHTALILPKSWTEMMGMTDE